MTLSFIGRYRLESRLGEGEWSESYQAYDLVNRRLVALRLLKPEISTNERTWRALSAELQRAAELVHPHIAWVWETGEEENRRFFTERFIAGETLDKQISGNGPMPWGEVLPLLEQIAQALHFGEARGYIHDQITPHNIIAGPELGAVLCDYALANAFIKVIPDRSVSIFNAHFLAPEVIIDRRYSPAAEGYALACLAVMLITGETPFSSKDIEEVIRQKNQVSAANLMLTASLLPIQNTPLPVGDVIIRALDPDPTYRYASPSDFTLALQQAIQRSLTDENLRRQHEEQVQRWREHKEKARIEAEEAARQAALSAAREEIKERARQEAAHWAQLDEAPSGPLRQDKHVQVGMASQRLRATRQSKLIWPVLILLLTILAVAGWQLSTTLTSKGRKDAGSPGNVLATLVETPMFELETSKTEAISTGVTEAALSVTPTITATTYTTQNINSILEEPQTPVEKSLPTRTSSPSKTPSPSPTLDSSNTPPPSSPTPIRSDLDRDRHVSGS